MQTRKTSKRKQIILLASLAGVLISVLIIFPLVFFEPEYNYMYVSSVTINRGEYLSGNFSNINNFSNSDTYNLKTKLNLCTIKNITHRDIFIWPESNMDVSEENYPNKSIDATDSVLHADSQYYYYNRTQTGDITTNATIEYEFGYNFTEEEYAALDKILFQYNFKSWIYVDGTDSYLVNQTIRIYNIDKPEWVTFNPMETIWYNLGKFDPSDDISDKESVSGEIDVKALNQTWLKHEHEGVKLILFVVRFYWYIDFHGKTDWIEHYAFIDQARLYTNQFEESDQPVIHVDFNFENLEDHNNYFIWFKAQGNLSRSIELQGIIDGVWTKLCDISTTASLYKYLAVNLRGIRIYKGLDDPYLCNHTKQIEIYYLMIAPV